MLSQGNISLPIMSHYSSGRGKYQYNTIAILETDTGVCVCVCFNLSNRDGIINQWVKDERLSKWNREAGFP